jgi:hypothetical protein
MTLELQLIERLQSAWNHGCPVAGSSPDAWEKMAVVARRRWFSFHRRNASEAGSRANKTEDLARGLCDAFERRGRRMAGPLISDYRWLAEQLAEILEAGENGTGNEDRWRSAE